MKAPLSRFSEASHSPATEALYTAAWEGFRDWCRLLDEPALPASPLVLAAYLASLAGRQESGSIRRILNAVRHEHKRAGLPAPNDDQKVRSVWAHIQKIPAETPGSTRVPIIDVRGRLVDALGPDVLKWMTALPWDARGQRDRLMVAFWRAGDLTPEQIARLNVGDVVLDAPGVPLLRIHTKRYGRAHTIEADLTGLPFDLNAVLLEWVGAITQADAGLKGRDEKAPLFRRIRKDGSVGVEGMTGPGVAIVVAGMSRKAGAAIPSQRSGPPTATAKRSTP